MLRTIHKKMLGEHENILKMLDDFQKSSNNSPKELEKTFSKFKWNLEKHFFIEEKVIFHIYNSPKEIENFDILSLLKEHKDILWIINSIEDDFPKNFNSQIEELKKILKAHATFENEYFYPRLDEELNEEQKQLILERIEEIIRE